MLKKRWIVCFAMLLAMALVACGGGQVEEAIDTASETVQETAAEVAETAEEVVEEVVEEAEEMAEEAEEMVEEVVEEAEEMVDEMMSDCPVGASGDYAGVSAEGVTVEWWHNHSGSRGEQLVEMIEDFNATNPCSIEIISNNIGGYGDISTAFNGSVAAGEVTNQLIVGYPNDQAGYQLNDALVDINVLISDDGVGLSAEEVDAYYQSFFNQSVHPLFGNQRLGFAPNRSIEMLHYNATYLEELGFSGPPTTPDEFVEMSCAAAAASESGVGGFVLRTDASAVAAWTFAFGGDLLTADGENYVYDSQATVDAMNMMQELATEGEDGQVCAYFFDGFPNPEVASRNALFAMGSSSGIPFYEGDFATVNEETGRTDAYAVAAIPHTTAEPVMNIYGGDVMIPRSTRAQELGAWEFVKWFTAPENQARWVEISNYFPTNSGTVEFLGDYIDANPVYGTAVDLLQFGKFEPQLPSYFPVRGQAEEAFNTILQGADVEGTLADLTESANELQAEIMGEISDLDVEESAGMMVEAECPVGGDGNYAGVSPEGATVEWWHNHSGGRGEQLNEMIADFNATNPCSIEVISNNIGGYGDISTAFNGSVAAGEVTNQLIVGYPNDQAGYQLNNALVDINLLIDDSGVGLSADEVDAYYQSFFNQSVHPLFDNQRLGFAPNRSIEMLHYNATYLEELGFSGPPTTPDEFVEMACAAAAASESGVGGFVLRDDASAVAAWTFAYGGDLLTADGSEYVYNSAETVAAMEMLQELATEGEDGQICGYFFDGFPNPEVASRNALFAMGSSSGIPFYEGDFATVNEETGRTDAYAVAAIPHTTADPVMNIYGGDVMIPVSTREQELAAWEFVKWFTAPENQARWVEISNYFPTNSGTVEFLGDYIDSNPVYGTAVDLLQFGKFEPQLPSYFPVRGQATEAFNAILGGADIQSTLDNLTEEANELQAEIMEEIEG